MKAAKVSANTKRPRGRPRTTGTGTLIGMRWHEPALKAIDVWRGHQPDLPSRADAIRRLVDLGLKSKARAR